MTGSTPVLGCQTTHRYVTAQGELFAFIVMADHGRHLLIHIVKTSAVCHWFRLKDLFYLKKR